MFYYLFYYVFTMFYYLSYYVLLPFLTTFSWNSLKITWPASKNVDTVHFEALNEKIVIRLAGPDPVTMF